MHTNTNRIPIATAAEVAARLPYPHTISGGWYRTSTAICHGGDHKTALSFQDGDRPGESPLRVHCHSRNCDPPAIRHALQQATALWICRCDVCFAAFRAGQPPPGTDATRLQGAQQASGRLRPPEWANRHSTPKNAGNDAQDRSASGQDKNTSAYAAALWAVAHASTSGPAHHHPAAKWLADRSLWPPAEPLPAAVRWLPRIHRKFPRGRPDSTAAGALVMAMRPLDNPTAPPRKIQLVAIDKAGRKARHWPDNADKRTYGTGPFYGLLWCGRLQVAGCDLHVCEGLADGLRILRYARDPALVAVCAGTGYARIQPGCFNAITLWPDADEAGARAANKTAQRWADQGYRVTVKRLAAGHDPASAPLQDPAHD